jgi:hypothetical protein
VKTKHSRFTVLEKPSLHSTDLVEHVSNEVPNANMANRIQGDQENGSGHFFSVGKTGLESFSK